MNETSKPASRHFGVIGKRDRWIAAYHSSKSFDSTDFRTGRPTKRWLHKFIVAGSVAIWWTGKELKLEKEEQVVLVATIKYHGSFTPKFQQPVFQTTLTRCDIHHVMLCESCGSPLIDKDKKCPQCKVRVARFEATKEEIEL